MLKLVCAFLFCIFSFSLQAAPTNSPKVTRVIYVTLDGTRWQDFFLDPNRFQKFWKKYAAKGHLYGAPNSHSFIEAASIPLSLPSYQAQMAGAVQPCDENDCGRIHVETFPEFLKMKKFGKRNIATFSSWPLIAFAVESQEGVTLTNTGNSDMIDPRMNKPDSIMAELNRQQSLDHPEGEDRFDKYTVAQALHYLKKYKPHFLWISLDDADNAAHDRDFGKYQKVLDYYDDVIDELFTTLQNLNLDKETLVIITTDHGRGNGDDWHAHGPEYPESKQTWGFVMNGELEPVGQDGVNTYYSTLSIRPTVEKVLL